MINEWGYGLWGDGIWGDFARRSQNLTGVGTLALALNAILTLENQAMDYAFESNTVRIWLTNLAHDLLGDPSDDATVTYIVYRANGDTHTSGSLTYYADRGWHASFATPSLSAGTSESLRVVVRAQYAGATSDFRQYVTVKDIAAV